MTDPTVDWAPMTGLLAAASRELEVGQLVHTSVFSLFEAMSAVEIGNPKMDAGELAVRPCSLHPTSNASSGNASSNGSTTTGGCAACGSTAAACC